MTADPAVTSDTNSSPHCLSVVFEVNENEDLPNLQTHAQKLQDHQSRSGVEGQRRLEANASADICIISSRHVSSSRTSFGAFYTSRVSLAAARLFFCEATRKSASRCNEIYITSTSARSAVQPAHVASAAKVSFWGSIVFIYLFFY